MGVMVVTIFKKTVDRTRKDWPMKLDDALCMGGSMLWLGVSMDTPIPRKKNYYMIFYFYLFFVCILEMMLIDGHPYLKSLDPPLALWAY